MTHSTALQIAGERNGLLVAVRQEKKSANGRWLWLWRCDCGNECVKDVPNVRNAKRPSCGCLTHSLISEARTSHGMSRRGSPGFKTFIAWQSMIWRCNNPARADYPRYGGRGIKVCERWESSFEAFLEDMGFRPDGLSIDRVRVDGDYEPSNCRWATATQQARNRSSNRYVTANGTTKLLCEWAEETGIPSSALDHRIAVWGADRAISAPYRRRKEIQPTKWTA